MRRYPFNVVGYGSAGKKANQEERAEMQNNSIQKKKKRNYLQINGPIRYGGGVNHHCCSGNTVFEGKT